jgi:hypothetical protein
MDIYKHPAGTKYQKLFTQKQQGAAGSGGEWPESILLPSALGSLTNSSRGESSGQVQKCVCASSCPPSLCGVWSQTRYIFVFILGTKKARRAGMNEPGPHSTPPEGGGRRGRERGRRTRQAAFEIPSHKVTSR